jgi:hypothetical protein
MSGFLHRIFRTFLHLPAWEVAMAAIIRRHRYWFGMLIGVLVLGLAWGLVTRLRAAPPAASQTPAVNKPHPFVAHSVDPNLNANTKCVADARKDTKHPERLSPLFMPADFNKAAFDANPQAYLDVVEPGRVWQTADPGPQVTRLNTKGPWMLDVAPGGNVTLSVTGVPLAPVTFTAFDGGMFDNQLNSMTVRADANGEAHVTFTATPGTAGSGGLKILAGSPLASDQAEFTVTVKTQ